MIDVAIARSDPLDEATFQRLRAEVPAERRRKTDRYHRRQDRYARVVSFALLQYLWRERSADPMPEVVSGEFGKPRFRGLPEAHFNWSHDASVCVCAFASVPIGIDLQSRVPFDGGLFECIAAPGEERVRDRLLRADDLSSLWTRKEALVKRTGRGLSTPLQAVDTLAAPDLLTLSCDEMDFRISVSAEGLSERELRSRLRTRWVRPNPAPGGWSEEPHRGSLRRLPFLA
ncbi:4'-phosphopantetheinyl transferase family protein [Glycomyces xiaoerkulensis]|uniref:4'-phosphopantetheinyl transferase family protein n=1 Tax=Glycomyces xiaoerkulensis TaxID=2038139 RepID=UPI000C26BBF0|nr:4'-phosphopantetheinyl transferase superfamily protein [Glycomyces xiaoerkulensis]